jgi:hypothetical protein
VIVAQMLTDTSAVDAKTSRDPNHSVEGDDRLLGIERSGG